MTNKARLEAILKGVAPDAPPHFEMVFNLEKEMFGIDAKAAKDAQYSSDEARFEALLAIDIGVKHRLIDELGWAAVPAMFYETGIDRIKSISRIKKELGDKALVWSFSPHGVYWMPTGEDMMDFVVKLFERPQELHAGAREKQKTVLELAKRQVDAGVDFLIQNTDFGFNKGPFISPKHFQEFVTPYMTEIVAKIHDMGIPVLLHSDGDLNLLLEEIYSTGIDGYQSVDPQGQMDIKEVREKYPDWILMGNVNCAMLQDADKAKIRQSVQYCMKYGGIGKRYIFSTSNCIFPGMPAESYRIMLDEYNRLIIEGK